MLTDGQSIITLIFLKPLFILLIISAQAIASKSLRFVPWEFSPSISFGLIRITSKAMAFFLIISARNSLLLFVSCFESLTPSLLNSLPVSSSTKHPARAIGPITGPLPASSIPRIKFI